MSNVVMCLFASGGFDKAALGLAGAARRLADATGGQVRAIVMGAGADAMAAEAARIADAVIVVDQAETAEYQPEICLDALTELCREMAPSAVLFSNDTYSQETRASPCPPAGRQRGWRRRGTAPARRQAERRPPGLRRQGAGRHRAQAHPGRDLAARAFL